MQCSCKFVKADASGRRGVARVAGGNLSSSRGRRESYVKTEGLEPIETAAARLHREGGDGPSRYRGTSTTRRGLLVRGDVVNRRRRARPVHAPAKDGGDGQYFTGTTTAS